jgi:acetylornithine deacetylase
MMRPDFTHEDHAIDAWLDAHHGELIELAQNLVRIPTENTPPTGGELEGQRFVQAQLEQLGAAVDTFTPDEVQELNQHPAYHPLINGEPRDFTNRPNVVGRFPGAGSGRSVILSTHMDTVPAGDPSQWREGTPYGGDLSDGRLYGRGSYDTKCALASHLHAIRCLQETGWPLAGDVTIESVVDEEYGGSHGVLAARLRGYNADVAINSEPTHLAVCPAHRGGREAYLRVQGTPGMAFEGQQPSDAVITLARCIVALKSFNDERNQGDVAALYRHDPLLPWYFNQIGGGGTTYSEAIGPPAETYLHFWAEVYEGTTAEDFDHQILGRLQRALDAHPDSRGQKPVLEPTIRFMPGSSMPREHPALDTLRDAFGSVSGRPFEVRGAPFACDAYVFNLHSPTPALILGPGGGGAHAPDEYVLIDDLQDLARICARFIARWCA